MIFLNSGGKIGTDAIYRRHFICIFQCLSNCFNQEQSLKKSPEVLTPVDEDFHVCHLLHTSLFPHVSEDCSEFIETNKQVCSRNPVECGGVDILKYCSSKFLSNMQQHLQPLVPGCPFLGPAFHCLSLCCLLLDLFLLRGG